MPATIQCQQILVQLKHLFTAHVMQQLNYVRSAAEAFAVLR